MQEKHADQGYRKLRDILKDMTWKQRWDHLIYYYSVAAVFAVLFLLMAVSLIVDVVREKPTVLLEGMTVNVRWTEEAETAMTTDLFDHIGGTDPKKELVEANHFVLEEFNNEIVNSITTRVYSGEMDYILVDKLAMDFLAPWEVFTDLTLLLPEDVLKEWELCLVYAQREGEEMYPIAIDISKTPFAAQCTYDGDHLYLGFTGNTKRETTPGQILEYLLSCF